MSEVLLKREIGERLEGAGFVRKPGTNTFTAPPGFAGAGTTTTVDTEPGPASSEKETPVAEGSVAADALRLLVERIERLSEEVKALQDDVKDVYGEAKARGYDTKTLRRVVALRKMETHHREEAAALLQTYASALGLQGVLL